MSQSMQPTIEPVLCDIWQVYLVMGRGTQESPVKRLVLERYFPAQRTRGAWKFPSEVKEFCIERFHPDDYISINCNGMNVYYWPVSKLKG